ncbi:MAG: Hpt domain-containing protein [Thiotrichales bacterium]
MNNDFASAATQALLVRYAESLREKATTLEALHNTLRRQPDRVSDWQTLALTVHRLGGSAGAYGFERIGDLAKRLDAAIRAQLERDPGGEASEHEGIFQQLSDLIDELHRTG